MKKILAIVLSAMMILTSISVFAVSADTELQGAPAAFENEPALYVHAVLNSSDSNAWQAWQSVHDEDFNIHDSGVKYFFLPTSADAEKVDIYNAFPSDVTVNGVKIASGETETVPYSTQEDYVVTAEGETYTLKYMKSNAEAAIYINNSDADGNGTELSAYLGVDKSRKATATGAIVTPDGSVDNTLIKKIKGRGNTSWSKPKKGYNITYDKKVSIAGMTKSKKYSILPNYQDDSLSRNRFLYDLSDAVGMPYASDSRYVDFYINGFYWGSYLICEKIEAGDLVYDVDEDGYLNADGTVKDDFSFIAEVDASATEGEDYFFYAGNGTKVTIKAPELEPGDVGYDEVKAYAKEKYDAFANAAKSNSGNLTEYADLDSVTKLYLINELGKNWDSGVSSTFFTYKPDSDGNYKFFGSPVWDYDNALGNAAGVGRDLNNMGVSDYTSYSGWWCRYKGKNSSQAVSSGNIINQLALNDEVLQAAPAIWFNEFVPAIEHFAGSKYNAVIDEELYTAEEYYSLIKDSAEMNYTSGWNLNTGSWIANHTRLSEAGFDYDTMTYTTSKKSTHFENDFEGMYDYAVAWMTSRAAWLSNEMAADFTWEKIKLGDADLNDVVNIDDVTLIQKYCAELATLDAKQFGAADVDLNGKVNIHDATIIQKFIAGYNIELPVKDDTQPDEPVQDDELEIMFSNALNWGGTIYCYYWSDEVKIVDWPGVEMESAGKNQYNEDLYTAFIPKSAEYVIFTNSFAQTEDIPFDGEKLGFYTVNTYTERDGKKRYDCVAYELS